jgi:hypothetical protein
LTAPVEFSSGVDTPDRLDEGGENSAPQEPQQDPSGQDPGWWLTEPDATKVKEGVIALWKSQNSVASKREAKERRGELTRAGVRGVRVVESTERDSFDVRVPLSAEDAPKAPNKADQLIRRVASTLTVDPPTANVTPTSDDDQERDASQLAERVLQVEGSQSERDDVSLLRHAIDSAGTYGSLFVYTYLQPQHELQPVEIQAHPAAQTVDDALVVTEMVPQLDEFGIEQMVEQQTPADPASLVTRYVRVDGSLTDTTADAQLGWQPRICEVTCRPSQIRFVPAVGPTCIEDAQGVLVGTVQTLSDVIARHYNGERPAKEVVARLVSWKPEGIEWKRWVPKALRELLNGEATPKRPDGEIADHALVVTLSLYLKSGPLAPLGVYVCIGGPDEPLTRDMWRATIGDGESQRIEYLPLPVSQMRWREDTATGDPIGVAGIDDLGPHEEIRSAMLRYTLDYIDNFGDRQTFIPQESTIQEGQIARGFRKPPIVIPPNSRPFFEDLPGLAPEVSAMYEQQGKEMDSTSSLEATAQGVNSPEVKSGRHAQQVIEQAQVGLAGLSQNAHKFMTRVWSLRLTFMRAFYAAPRVLKYLGEGGDYQQRAWSGMDLMGAGDIQIARGSGTMMPRSAKAMLAREELETAMATGDQLAASRYRRAIDGGITPLLGMQDDPVRNRINRQLALWREQAKLQHEPPSGEMMQQMVPDPMGNPMPQMMPAPDPVLEQAMQIFAPNPTDDLPTVAPIRLAELVDACASRAYEQADPRFQQAITQELLRMKQAAGVMTVAEQQQAAQMQQQQAAQQEMAMAQQKNAPQPRPEMAA